jgi:hypothetical protein
MVRESSNHMWTLRPLELTSTAALSGMTSSHSAGRTSTDERRCSWHLLLPHVVVLLLLLLLQQLLLVLVLVL